MQIAYICEKCNKTVLYQETVKVVWDRSVREKKRHEFSIEERHSDYRIVCAECGKLPHDKLFH